MGLSRRKWFPPCWPTPKTLWVGTLSGGLLRWRGGHWDRFGVQDGLFSNEVLGIAEDHGWLWLTSSKGISRVRSHDLEALNPGSKVVVPCIVYGKSDGLESIVCGGAATPTVWKTSDGRFVLPPPKGWPLSITHNSGLDFSPPGPRRGEWN